MSNASDARLLLQVEARKKSGWLAAFLNLLLPGAGYVYCGMWVVGILAFLFIVAVAIFTAGLGLVLFWPIIFIDGFLAAGRHNRRVIAQVLRQADQAAVA